MIHYTLLPQEEMKSLRLEYRVRLFIVATFFISCGVVLGIISLLPSYIVSHSQESDVMERAEVLRANRKASGIEEIEKDLAKTQVIAQKIQADRTRIVYSESIEKIISHRSAQVFLSAFQVSNAVGTSTPYEVVVQGKANSRESLLEFKKGLEEDATFSKVELPLSDLARSKNISFSLKLTLK